MSVLLRRGSGLQDVSVEALEGVNAQGKPQYSAAEEIRGRVVEGPDAVERGATTTGASGDEEKVLAIVWVDASEDVIPENGHRLTLESGLVGVAVERKVVRRLRDGAVDHVRVKIVRE